MDFKFSLLCVWIQTMLITSHAEVTVDCPDQRITEKQMLTLSCTVKCDDKCTIVLYKWKNDSGVIHQANFFTTIESSKMYDYTIENPLVSKSGIYQFWIQTKKGTFHSTFTVTIERGTSTSSTPERGTSTSSTPDNNFDEQQKKKHTDENGSTNTRSPKGAAAVLILIVAVVLPIIFVVAYKKSNTFRSMVTSWFSCSAKRKHVEYKYAVEDDCKI